MVLLPQRLRRWCTLCRCTPETHPDEGDEAHHRRRKRVITSADPYVTVKVSGARTRVIPNSRDPLSDERFKIPLAHFFSHLLLHVKDNVAFGAQLIGTVPLPLRRRRPPMVPHPQLQRQATETQLRSPPLLQVHP
ncbi:phospholipase D delta-like [Iris pallida]|uniref:Phospholipase D delta-like n=1 Tax=Iris pallida TaxID=29817 RepID=A0AAX6HCU6_IRIPA|nr:phospholipase D delta-like [Iris pallida]